MILSLIGLSLLGSTLVSGENKALKFGATQGDYMKFYPNMTPFANALSACTWVMKGIQPSSIWRAPIILDYHTHPTHNIHELLMTDNGGFNRLFNGMQFDGKLGGSFTAPLGAWFHYCVTWSSVSNSQRIYVDGALVGQTAMPAGRTLTPGGVATMGNRRDIHPYYPFGGQITKFNVFSKEMTAAEVKEMADAGVCSSVEETRFGESRALKWEYILAQPKTGNVVPVELETCEDEKMKEELERLQQELEDTKKELEEYKKACEEAKRKLQEEIDATKSAAEEAQSKMEEELKSLEKKLEEALKAQCPGEGIWSVPKNLIGKKIKKRQIKKWKKAGEDDLVRYLSSWKGAKLTKDLARYIECFQTV